MAWEYSQIGRVLKEIDADLIFSPYQIGPTPPNVQSVLMLRNMEPFLYQNYDSPFTKNVRNFLLRELCKRSCERATHIVAVSRYVEEFAIRELGIPANRISRIYHGRDPKFSPNIAERDDELLREAQIPKAEFLLTCGSLLPYRRCEDVIRASRRKWKSFRPAKPAWN